LTLTDFRCYGAARIEADGRPLVLTGPNGAGKTNLLEAVSMLAPGRGLRRARLSELDRRAPASEAALGAWAVATEIETASGPVALGTARDEDAERRTVRIDGVKARGASSLAEHMA